MRLSTSAVSRNIVCGSLSIVAWRRSSRHCLSSFSANTSLLIRDGVSELRQFLVLKELVHKAKERFIISPHFRPSRKVLDTETCIPCSQVSAAHAMRHRVPATPPRSRNRFASALRFVGGWTLLLRRFAGAILPGVV